MNMLKVILDFILQIEFLEGIMFPYNFSDKNTALQIN
jgi:hypothetical protein